jgi:outer membrane protein
MKAPRIHRILSVLVLGIGLRAAAEPLTLEEARATALRNHPQVAIARLQELVAQEVIKQNRSAYFPTADAYLDGVDAGNRNTRILAGGLNNPVIYDRVADGLAMSELITDFGRTGNLVASAKLSAKAETANVAATNQQILLSVDVNYFNALQAQAVLKVAQETLSVRQLLVDQVTALEKNKLRSEIDVSFAEVALEQSRLIMQKAVGDAEGAQASLSAALGYRVAHHFELTKVPNVPARVPDAETLVSTAMSERPDLRRLRYQRDAAGRFARAQKDRNYPTVAAIGEAGNAMSHDYRLPDKYAAVGIAVDFPLFAGGEYLSLQHMAELKAQIADQALRDQEDNVSRDVRMAWLNFSTAVQRFRTTEQLLKHANEAYSLAQARYKIGSSSIVELSDAQVNATSAQIADANARYDELIEQAILDYQTGVLR